MKLPNGYRPITFKELNTINPLVWRMLNEHLSGTRFEFEVYDEELKGVQKIATVELIDFMESRGEIQFTLAPNGEPGMFMVAEDEFKSPMEFSVAKRLLSFWDKTGDFDAAQGKILKPALPPFKLPHWQMAFDQKVAAIKALSFVEKFPGSGVSAAKIAGMGLEEDLAALKVADVYSFNGETMHAIMTGAQSIPHESTLQSVEVPSARAGWFWFDVPFPAKASPLASDNVAALLWSWDDIGGKPGLRFSAYVVDEKSGGRFQGEIVPSTKWVWPADYTFHQMIGLSHRLYENAYGENGPMRDAPHRIGEEGTLKVVAELSLFFLMSCVWFKQTVITQEPGHIERHARKRAMKELKLDVMPSVRVVALRKAAAHAVEHVEGVDGEKRHVHVRFVVSGHPRLQACGPEHKDRKLIWVAPFVKGRPEDPFKESGPRVFAVVR